MTSPINGFGFKSVRFLEYKDLKFELVTVKIQYGIKPHFELKLINGYHSFFVKFTNTDTLRNKLEYLIKQYKSTNVNGKRRK